MENQETGPLGNTFSQSARLFWLLVKRDRVMYTTRLFGIDRYGDFS